MEIYIYSLRAELFKEFLSILLFKITSDNDGEVQFTCVYVWTEKAN